MQRQVLTTELRAEVKITDAHLPKGSVGQKPFRVLEKNVFSQAVGSMGGNMTERLNDKPHPSSGVKFIKARIP